MPEPENGKTHVDGIVIRSTGSWYDVQVGDEVVPCKVRGRFRLNEGSATNPVVVGDRVTLRREEDSTGLITDIHQRVNALVRRAAGRRVGRVHMLAANVDFAWVVQSVALPKFNAGFVDRFLVMAAVQQIPMGIVINKVDLLTDKLSPVIEDWEKLYRGLGYPVMRTSAATGIGIDAFRGALAERTSVVMGPSGVGKSSLLNRVGVDVELRTQEVSVRTRKGKHTTTNATLLSVDEGGFVVDTPGLREFGLVDLEPGDLSHYFPEMRALLHQCKFPNCQHDHEPGCAVKDAADEGEMNIERYDSYLGMLYSLRLGAGDVGR